MPARRSTVDLTALFSPRSVALVGASPNSETARAALHNLTDGGFDGTVYAVNPRYDEVLGVPCFSSVAALPEVPDCVVAAVNRERVLDVVSDAAAAGVSAAVVFAIGFAETGSEGAERQRQLQELAATHRMAILGPNCQGLINFDNRACLFMDEVKPYRPGSLGLIAQSGSISTALINNDRGVAWRYAASTGNEAVVAADDLLWHMVEDPECRGVCLFLETIRRPDNFFAACDAAAERGKPVIVLKTGKTEASQQAAEAHSGALAVPDRLVDARFRRHGVIRVESLEEMLETAIALQAPTRPRGGGLATMTASGGQIEMVLDSAEPAGLVHPTLAPDTAARVRAILPDFLDVKNPLDWWGVEDESAAYPALASLLAHDESIDFVVAVVDQTTEPTGDGRFQRQLDTALELAGKVPALFVLLDSVGGVSPPERVREALDAGVLLLSGFEPGIRALAHLVDFASRPRTVARGRGRSDVDTVPPLGPDAFSGSRAMDLLRSHGISCASSAEVTSAEDAVSAALEVGFPVVVKLADSEVTHKTEVGGVVTGLMTPEDVRAAAARLFDAGYGGVLVQPQLTGVELILGITRHRDLGTFLVVGLGGIWTELLGEVQVVPAGLLPGEAEEIVKRMRGHELLEGARDTEPLDVGAVVAAIEGLDQLALALGDQVASVDVNPLIVTADGAYAVDALIVPDASAATTTAFACEPERVG